MLCLTEVHPKHIPTSITMPRQDKYSHVCNAECSATPCHCDLHDPWRLEYKTRQPKAECKSCAQAVQLTHIFYLIRTSAGPSSSMHAILAWSIWEYGTPCSSDASKLAVAGRATRLVKLKVRITAKGTHLQLVIEEPFIERQAKCQGNVPKASIARRIDTGQIMAPKVAEHGLYETDYIFPAGCQVLLLLSWLRGGHGPIAI